MIDNIQLKFGSSGENENAEISVSPLTVFVGPNFSGKSKALSEIFEFCKSGDRAASDVIIEKINFSKMPEEKVEHFIKEITGIAERTERIGQDEVPLSQFRQLYPNYHDRPDLTQLKGVMSEPQNAPHLFCSYFLTRKTIMLNGKNRMNLETAIETGDLKSDPKNVLQHLFMEDVLRQKVRELVHDAFDVYFVIDPTDLGKLKVNFSSEPPANNFVERGLHSEAVTFHRNAMPIESVSDGLKAFSGIIAEIVAGNPIVILIDEPEAFLHPPLAGKLGKRIAEVSKSAEKRVFAATHSSHFLLGCINSGVETNIVRLTYSNSKPTATILENEEIIKLMRNPLLRSTGVIEGLFHDYVVVMEGDTDRVFYQEINDRLLSNKHEWGIPNCLFVHTQGKDSMHSLVSPLRKLGIPTATIVDIDIIKWDDTKWKQYLESGLIPADEKKRLIQDRITLVEIFKRTDKNLKTDGGINILQGNNREFADNFFDCLDSYGLFTVRNGELESWLKHLQVKSNKKDWLRDIFRRLGVDPEHPNYVSPENTDVWKFLEQVKIWLTTTNRKGMSDLVLYDEKIKSHKKKTFSFKPW